MSRRLRRPEVARRVRPTTVIVAHSLSEAQGYAMALPVRHVEIMSRHRAVSQHGLHGLAPGTTVHILPSAHRGNDDLLDVAMEGAIEHLRRSGFAVVEVVPDPPPRRVPRPRGAEGHARNRQPSKEEP